MIIPFERQPNAEMIDRLNTTRLLLAKQSIEQNVFALNINVEDKKTVIRHINEHVSL